MSENHSSAAVALREKADASAMDSFAIFAYGSIFGVFGIALAVTSDSFKAMWLFPASGGLDLALYIAKIVFFLEVLALVVAWVVSTKDEMRLWKRRLANPPETVERKQVYLAIIGLALVLGLALAFPYNPLFITFFLTVSWLVNYWTQWLCLDHFSGALERTKAKSAAHQKVLAVMKHYWLVRPQLGRIATMMFWGAMAFSLAFAAAFQPGPRKTLLQFLSYCILFMDILVGELTIWWWRINRDRDMNKAEGKERLSHAHYV